ncbi:hypothetical protein J6O48_07070 [bacterium]|nr:hypothetical protein [bacterium]
MEELEKRTHELKFAIRQAINSSGLPMCLVETVLDSLKSEVISVELTTLRQSIIAEEAQKQQMPVEVPNEESGVIKSGICKDNMGE